MAYNLANDKNLQLRSLYIQTLSQIEHEDALKGLVLQSLLDIDDIVRLEAAKLATNNFPSKSLLYYVQKLKDRANVVVLRSAIALKMLNDRESIPGLIDSLETTHRYKVFSKRNGNSVKLSMPANSPFSNYSSTIPADVRERASDTLLSRGLTKKRSSTVIVTVSRQNQECLDALVHITEMDFEFDETKWRTWWEEQNTATQK